MHEYEQYGQQQAPQLGAFDTVEVDWKLALWGISFLALGSYLFGGQRGTTSRTRSPQRRRSGAGPAKSEARSAVDDEAISALRNLGYNRSEAESAVQSARRAGAQGFDAVMRKSLSRLGPQA